MDFGQGIYELIQSNVTPIFLGVLVGMSVYYLIKKEVSKFAGFVVVAILTAGFVFIPDLVKDLFVNIFKKIFRL
ncbi:MAG: hypothetical protein ACI33I_05855 [Clostridium sp.]